MCYIKIDPQAQNNLRQFCRMFHTESVYRPPREHRDQQPPEFVSFQYTARQEAFKQDVLDAHNVLARDIRLQVEELMDQLTEGMVRPCLSLDSAKMKGQINFMLDRWTDQMSGEGSRRLLCQLRLMELLVDSVDLAETIGVGIAAAKIRDVVKGTGDGGCMADELGFSGFPLADYIGVLPAEEGTAVRDSENTDVVEEEDRDPSPRLVNLNDQLRKYLANKQQQDADGQDPTKSRILVFVKTRSAVNTLRSYLTRHYPELNPNIAVGHSGQGGQSWGGGGDTNFGQAAVIRDFHKGDCQLLVCTTVLEEGIDVSACDLVIRYSGVNTLIQFIQSRGRARREGSRYVIIVTPDEHHRAINLDSQERMMDYVLSAHATAQA